MYIRYYYSIYDWRYAVLSIRNAELERLARALAGSTGKTMTETILEALVDLERDAKERFALKKAALASIAAACAAAPDLDARPADEILGYDETGAFGDGGR